MYFGGRGVPQDDAEAVRWIRLAAGQGYFVAQVFLSLMYERGKRVPQDYVSAHMWLNIAAANGAGPKYRDTLSQRMSAADISEAQRRARVCVASGYQDCD
jgi:uncharacterized protein